MHDPYNPFQKTSNAALYKASENTAAAGSANGRAIKKPIPESRAKSQSSLVATDPNAERKRWFLSRLEQVFIVGYLAVAKNRRFFPNLQIKNIFLGIGWSVFRIGFFINR